MTLIRRGERSGRCISCALAARGRNGLLAGSPEAVGLRGSQLHVIWGRMWNRCTNPNADNWAYYGGRGIQVCERWKVFDAFIADMGPSYRDGLTIERIDTNGPYSPENCCWKTMLEQSNNTRRNRFVTFEGRTQTISQWATELGMSYWTLYQRLVKRGWPPERALTADVMPVGECAKLGAEARWHGA